LSIWIPSKDAYAYQTNYADIWNGVNLAKIKNPFK
jgi:hypothetical protein